MKLILLALMLFSQFVLAESCEDWFQKSKITVGSKDCELLCASFPTGMGTFMCPSQCKDLCKTVFPRSAFDLIPKDMATKEERDLVSKFPLEALRAYQDKLAAENSTERLFSIGIHNTEADAFRHFIWSGLMTKSIGSEKARLFLQLMNKEKINLKKS